MHEVLGSRPRGLQLLSAKAVVEIRSNEKITLMSFIVAPFGVETNVALTPKQKARHHFQRSFGTSSLFSRNVKAMPALPKIKRTTALIDHNQHMYVLVT
jgi:hypothetical protein